LFEDSELPLYKHHAVCCPRPILASECHKDNDIIIIIIMPDNMGDNDDVNIFSYLWDSKDKNVCC